MANEVINYVPSGNLPLNSKENEPKKDKQVIVRDQWSSKLDFILSCVGYAIGKFFSFI